MQLFRNLSANLTSSFKLWRNINQIEKMREKMGMNERGAAIRALETLVHGGINTQIRNAIAKFRQNRKTVDIQRNFLKRLLNSKAGMVVSAFRRIQTLPERKNMEAYGRATKFERGLSSFVDRISKRTFESFRNSFE